MFFLAILLVYSLLHRAYAVAFIVNFFVVYILYTAFEARMAMKK